MGTMVLPGVYITVRDEGLISVGGISVGTVGVVGAAEGGEANESVILSSYTEAKEIFGIPLSVIEAEQAKVDAAKLALDEASEQERAAKQNSFDAAKQSFQELLDRRYRGDLLEALELVFSNGASSVYAVRVTDNQVASYKQALAKLENEIINIVTIAGQDATNVDVMSELKTHLAVTTSIQRERIGVAGCGISVDIDDILSAKDNVVNDEGRLIYVAPGITTTSNQSLSGAHMAAAFTGRVAGLPVRTSPTNKTLNFKGKLAANYNFGQLEKLVQANVVGVERRNGYRIVKGVTSSTNSAWRQITTRRIVDKSIYGVRAACNPYIGKLNNSRVRAAMKATLDGFLTRMVEEESLTNYELEVSATRPQEIAGIAVVTVLLQPTFSIDYVQVTMTLG